MVSAAQENDRSGRLDDDDRAICAQAIKTGSHSFHAAARLLPERVRLPAQAIYAFCRALDDVVDGQQDNAVDGPVGSIAGLRERLDSIYRGRPQDLPCDRAFAVIANRFHIPREVPAAMLEGFAWDVAGRTYGDIEELLDYCARVAGTVGVMMACVMGARRRESLARAAELGLAMQLTNIARDVGEDARAGRVYLPRDWLREEGLSHERLVENPRFTPALGRVVKRLLACAEEHYRQGMTGIASLPRDCRPAIHAAAMIYRAIGRQVAANGYDSIAVRARTTPMHKARCMAWAMAVSLLPEPVSGRDGARAIAFLVEAARGNEPAATGVGARFSRFVELLETNSRRHHDWLVESRERL